MPERALTLRLDEATYQDLRKEAFDREVSITAIVRESLATRPARRELTIRPNPPIPSDQQLIQMWRLNGGLLGAGGLRAVWRNGCDAGMVAPSGPVVLKSDSGVSDV